LQVEKPDMLCETGLAVVPPGVSYSMCFQGSTLMPGYKWLPTRFASSQVVPEWMWMPQQFAAPQGEEQTESTFARLVEARRMPPPVLVTVTVPVGWVPVEVGYWPRIATRPAGSQKPAAAQRGAMVSAETESER
jgi:hypothetical protein